jgi:antitoxin VapB
MGERRRVRLQRIVGVQVVRIPAGLDLPGDEAVLRREGERLVIEPVRQRDLVALLASMEPIEEAWPEIEDPVPEAWSL